jgi:hypothetical protein
VSTFENVHIIHSQDGLGCKYEQFPQQKTSHKDDTIPSVQTIPYYTHMTEYMSEGALWLTNDVFHMQVYFFEAGVFL